jgi:HD superfamily phosphohydrolase
VGHGPLSHTTEEVMPTLGEVNVPVYKKRRTDITWPKHLNDPKRRANHEDYTIKFITDSSLTKVLEKNLSDVTPVHVACLIDKTLLCPDDFFEDEALNYRPILSQLVSSELDVDRMDYLERDAYFCGTNYGRVEQTWLISNLTSHIKNEQVYLAINRRALYAFDDFLLARHHMNLMVYFHHKSIIYEEMLMQYLNSKECAFRLPADIDEYLSCTDYSLYEHLADQKSDWARRITERRPFKVVFEFHATEESERVKKMAEALEKADIQVIFASSSVRLSKYHGGSTVEKNFPIYVVDKFDKQSKPYPIEESTAIFQKYDEIRRIDRLYVPPEQFKTAEEILTKKKL